MKGNSQIQDECNSHGPLLRHRIKLTEHYYINRTLLFLYNALNSDIVVVTWSEKSKVLSQMYHGNDFTMPLLQWTTDYEVILVGLF